MYAIIRAGGKQYKVQAGDTVRIEKIAKNLGETFNMPEVLMVGGDKTFAGSPLLDGAKVTVIVTRQAKNPKVIVFKKKRRQGYRKMQGHRQLFTELFVQSITSPEGQSSQTDKKAVIVDPAKAQARKEAFAQKQKETGVKKTAKVAAKSGVSAAGPAKPKSSKSAAKKTASKKTATKKAAQKTDKKTTTKKSSK